MKCYSIVLLSILSLLTVLFVLSSASVNEGTDAKDTTLTNEEAVQQTHLRHRDLSHKKHKRSKIKTKHYKKSKRKHHGDESESKSMKKKKENKSSKIHKKKSTPIKGGKKHHKGKKGDSIQVDECDCSNAWSETSCVKWDAGNLILTLEQEKCAEECCSTREKNELVPEMNRTRDFHENEVKKEEEQSF